MRSRDIVYDDTDLPALMPLRRLPRRRRRGERLRARARPGYAEARPVWAEVDLGAITHNLALLRERAGRPVQGARAGEGKRLRPRRRRRRPAPGVARRRRPRDGERGRCDGAARGGRRDADPAVRLATARRASAAARARPHADGVSTRGRAGARGRGRRAARRSTCTSRSMPASAGSACAPTTQPALVREVLAARSCGSRACTRTSRSTRPGEEWSQRRAGRFADLVERGRGRARHQHRLRSGGGELGDHGGLRRRR